MAKTKAETVKGGFLEGLAGEGLEHIGQDDLQIPRLKLLQALSPELDKNKPNYISGAANGEFILTIPAVSLGDKVQVIPLQQRTYWIEYLPGRGGFVGRHTPGTITVDKSDFSNWFRPENGNEIVESRDWVVIVKGYESLGPVMVSFTSSGIKSSKTWMSLLSVERTPSGKPAPIFAHIWELSAEIHSNDKGSWTTIGANPKKVRMITEKEYTSYISDAFVSAGALLSDAPVIAQIEDKKEVQQIDY